MLWLKCFPSSKRSNQWIQITMPAIISCLSNALHEEEIFTYIKIHSKIWKLSYWCCLFCESEGLQIDTQRISAMMVRLWVNIQRFQPWRARLNHWTLLSNYYLSVLMVYIDYCMLYCRVRYAIKWIRIRQWNWYKWHLQCQESWIVPYSSLNNLLDREWVVLE